MGNNSGESRDLEQILVDSRRLSERVDNLQQTVASLSGSLVTLERMIMNCATSIATVKAELMLEIKQNGWSEHQRCGSVDGSEHAVSPRMDVLENSLNSRCDRVAEEVTAMGSTIASCRNEFADTLRVSADNIRREIEDRLDEVSRTMANDRQRLQADITDLKRSYSSMVKREELEAVRSAIVNKIGAERNERIAAPVGCSWEFNQYSELAHRGDAAAQFWIGKRFYYGGSGVKKDRSAAAGWFWRSAEGGNTEGMWNLGYRIEGGEDALGWRRKSADGGNAVALGFCCESGEGVKKDARAAASWYRKSAEGGNTDGMSLLGNCYRDGKGVVKDLSAAVSWFRKSAEGGNEVGMEELGRCYWKGREVEKDEAKAHFWWKKSRGEV